jgi:hypothetical protein
VKKDTEKKLNVALILAEKNKKKVSIDSPKKGPA